jgi:hypothetical protein
VVLVSPRRSVLSDAEGRFVIDSVPAGLRHLIIRRIGFLPVRPSVRVPQSERDSLQAVLLPAPQNLPTLVVETERPGIRGVVGDTGYHALPGTLVELLGGRVADTTDAAGRFSFDQVKQGHYMMRVSRVGYLARMISVNLGGEGKEYSVFLEPYRAGMWDWANTPEASNALVDLNSRLIGEPRRTRLTRAELERFGSLPLCDLPQLRQVGADPSIIVRATLWRNATLCAWTADEVDLLEFGPDPCREAFKTIAALLNIYCGPTRGQSAGYSGGQTGMKRPGYVVIWPRG